MTKFIPEVTIERKACDLLARYRARTGELPLPIPIERIVEDELDLSILWDSLGVADDLILAGLSPEKKRITFNEDAKSKIVGTPGLYETVLAHEAGHWVLQADQGAHLQTALPGLGAPNQCWYRSTGHGRDPEEFQAHRFMAFLLMPTEFLVPRLEGKDLTVWPVLYRLRDEFDVTISALVKRLETARFISVDNATHKITETRSGALS